jgi:hypothetical protein
VAAWLVVAGVVETVQACIEGPSFEASVRTAANGRV